MKNIFFFLLLFCTATNAQQSFTGAWKGKLAAFNLTIVFHISEIDGRLTASMDSPDQGAKGIACDQVTVDGNSITITSAMIGASYTGSLSEDKKTITGKFNQGGGSFDLILGKGEIPVAKPKPQTPQPPFSYHSEDLEFDNADKTVRLAGTLTYPKSGNKFPVAILISGSGQQDRDETIMGHKPFAVIADRLTKLGFAVLRVDDRGIGKSTGEVAKASSADFAKDVITGIEYLKSRKEIDPKKIGLIGHSEGGLIAPIIAAERNDIDFMILLAGPGIKGAELLAEQGEQLILQGGVSKEAVQNYLPLYKKFIQLSAEGHDSATLNRKGRLAFTTWKQNSNPDLIKAIGFTDEKSTEAILESLISGFSAPWMQFFLASDASLLLEKTSAKVLALNGEKDVQVIAVSNTEGIKKALQKSKSPSYEVKILPGLNHLFQKCTLCTVNEYGMLDETFSETALDEMSKWLQKNVLQ
jgi:uncharacterized protein